MKRTIVLTGDRPTGKMHLGHYVGSLRNRFEMQDEFRCFFMIADYQALTTHQDRTGDLATHVQDMVLDYLAAGFDPEKSACFLQSQVPQLAELTAIFFNLVTLPRLLRNPTIREETEKMGWAIARLMVLWDIPCRKRRIFCCFARNTCRWGRINAPMLNSRGKWPRDLIGCMARSFPFPRAFTARC